VDVPLVSEVPVGRRHQARDRPQLLWYSLLGLIILVAFSVISALLDHYLDDFDDSGWTKPRVIGKYGASKVVMVPAGPGTGVKAGPGVREVLAACGIKNILTKTHGSTNPINLVKATLNGLMQLRTREDVARLRGVEL